MANINREEALKSFGKLLDIMDDLREKCPWDRIQTNESLSSLTIEEAYELTDAIQANDPKGIEEELGDILLHMVFYAKIGEESDQFDITSAIDKVCEKLIRRHPHIYGDVHVTDDEEVKQNWERLKMAEGKKSIFQGVPAALPPLVKAQRMQEKAAKVGFEWEEAEEVWSKVEEEIGELREAVVSGTANERIGEFGDLLFALVNYGRFIEVDAHYALEKTNKKFRSRVEYIEKQAQKPLSEMTLGQMDALWNEAKNKELV